MFEDLSGVQNVLDNLVREGTVSSVNTVEHRCRVTFSDRGGLVTAELPILIPFASKNKIYSLPDVGDRVVVLSVSNDPTGGNGYVVGCLYAGENEPNVNSQDVTQIEFSDETTLTYNRAEHKLSVICQGELSIEAEGDITIRTEKSLNLSAGEELSITAGGKAEISSGESMNISGSGIDISGGRSIKLKASRIDLN